MSHLTSGPFTFQFRRGTASEWTLDNPILHAGEPGFESDTGKLKMGDGVHAWTALEYFLPGSLGIAGVVSVDGRSGTVTLADLYAAISHTHTEAQVTNLVSDLAGKAAATHTHAEADVTGLVSDLASINTSLSGKAAAVHSHTESDVTGLTTDLAGKAASVHTHAASDVTSGTFAIGRIPTGTSGSTVALGNHSHVAGPAPVDLVDGATVATDASLGNYFRVTLAGNRTLGNPTNATDGQKCLWEVKQDATGTRTLTLGSDFIFGADLTSITLSTAANKRDLIGAIYNATLAKWLVTAFTKGF